MTASSYAGNVLACRAALATLAVLQGGNLISDTGKKGEMIVSRMRNMIRRFHSVLLSVTGRGLLIGIETADTRIAQHIVREMIHDGVIVLTAFGRPSVLMIEPPLVISFDQIDHVLRSLERACSKVA
jgi:acetylornithine/succinyldiaminopimelate/putrescine aminotransferase